MEFLEKTPALKKQFEALYENRQNEILSEILKKDEGYIKLNNERAEASTALREVLDDEAMELFEKYSDSLYAHEIYEIDTVYRQAVLDTLTLLQENGMI